MTVAGATTQVTPELDAVLRFDGEGGFSALACNELGGTADVSDNSLVLSEIFTTDMDCSAQPGGEIDDALGGLAGAAVRWSIAGEQLRLTGTDGTSLTYRVRASIYPHASAREVVSGERSGFQYRLAVDGSGDDIGLHLDWREGAGRRWGTQGHGAPAATEPPLWTLIWAEMAAEVFVGGFVPAETVRVTHRSEAGAPEVDLPVYSLDGSGWKVAVGFVPAHSPDSQLVGYDDAGGVTAEWG
jgi:hypothetical protein